ncbi:MAG: hypothetical protein SCAL_001619 [Candidatus Syntrophoarchaeum caldarius]|uniref:Uncharacterized protein n=1 Tax=Candidatus Syntropharchaeum caldarium TaxID=1838285 RepID=A0A1F2P7R3_9EURY|nr:MAG: hypothetical protein SCAL_001619 [Candidatus Syntrophoarchaeum caldarius]
MREHREIQAIYPLILCYSQLLYYTPLYINIIFIATPRVVATHK